ncbi:MAG: glycosyltransferase family 9 protein [Planctomycetes bacterium]|nr:glycosyltransferase family 9 protein [Planctomycetota bacterium]
MIPNLLKVPYFKSIEAELNHLKAPTIAISRPDGLGDVLMTLPMAGAIAEKYPNAKIIYIGIDDLGKGILEKCKYIHQNIYLNDFKGEDDRLVEYIKSLKIDAIVQLFKNKMPSIAKKANIPYRIGTFQRSYIRSTCNRFVYIRRGHGKVHASLSNYKSLKPLGINPPEDYRELRHYIDFSPENTIFKDLNRSKYILGVHIGGRTEKRFPIKRYCQIAKMLMPFNIQIVFIGMESELSNSQDAINNLPDNIINYIGRTSAADLISLINQLNGLLSTSSGPMHIAGILNKDIVALFQKSKNAQTTKWMPFGDNINILLDPNSNTDSIENILNEDIYSTILNKTSLKLYSEV